MENEIEQLKLQFATLNAQLSALVGFCAAVLQATPEPARSVLQTQFAAQCEGLVGTMLGTPGEDVDRSIDAVQLVRQTLLGSDS